MNHDQVNDRAARDLANRAKHRQVEDRTPIDMTMSAEYRTPPNRPRKKLSQTRSQLLERLTRLTPQQRKTVLVRAAVLQGKVPKGMGFNK